MKRILVIFGTRPEAIKLVPIIVELKRYSDIRLRICVTAQHRQMLDQVLGLFGIVPDIDLDLMQPGQTLAELTARVIIQVDQVFREETPDVVIVQGDTTTVMAASMAAFYRNVKVAHVEAGLRSGDMFSPFPEEMNRRVTTIFSALHFAPTERAVNVLLQEGIPGDRIFLTGNPVIDALQMILQKPVPAKAETLLCKARVNGSDGTRRLILVTAHRRENFGVRFESLCYGIKSLAERNPDTTFIYPVHLNPNVQEPVFRILGDTERIFLTDPVEYDVLAHLMKASYLILTDSGGIQEEAPSLGKPVLVMRTETERPEGIEAGTAKLVGTDAERIVTEAEALLRDTETYHRMSKAINPYGDGRAAKRIADILLSQM
jgi:UDP-N-acetylglucosamine 2-epimerase (non-hydrolysing)